MRAHWADPVWRAKQQARLRGSIHFDRRTAEEVFLSHVAEDKHGCLVWTGYCTPSTGYGTFTAADRRIHAAHRFALERRLRRKIRSGYQALHNCPRRNLRCVRHLYEGTPTQNQLDRVGDGTDCRGVKHPMVKLKPRQVLSILRAERRPGMYNDLAKRFGVTRFTINMIRSRLNWQHQAEEWERQGKIPPYRPQPRRKR